MTTVEVRRPGWDEATWPEECLESVGQIFRKFSQT